MWKKKWKNVDLQFHFSDKFDDDRISIFIQFEIIA